MIDLTWDDVFERCEGGDAPFRKKLFGIPRGGVHIAQLLVHLRDCYMVDDPHLADYLVDDVYDSGRTSEAWLKEYPAARFWVAYDKRQSQYAGQWLVFPWEKYQAERPAEDSAARLLESLGIDLGTDGTRETPERMVKALREMTEGYSQDPESILTKRFAADYDEMVVVRDIQFYSLCEHHVLPFYGTATVGYIGLSKIGRLVRCYSRRLQLQERLTNQVAYAIEEHLESIGVGVLVKAHHLCMAMRGSECPAEMVTSTLLGKMREPAVRAEFLALAKVNGDG
jgi:GTP cyclohydrolase I